MGTTNRRPYYDSALLCSVKHHGSQHYNRLGNITDSQLERSPPYVAQCVTPRPSSDSTSPLASDGIATITVWPMALGSCESCKGTNLAIITLGVECQRMTADLENGFGRLRRAIVAYT